MTDENQEAPDDTEEEQGEDNEDSEEEPEDTESDNTPETPDSSDAAPPSAAPPSDDNAIDVVGQKPSLQALQVNSNDLKNKDALWAQDLANGHVTPETYADLFAKKDTLGKIGTLFGLMIGGAGAGLTHQPNALLGLMQKQIDNDLSAQQSSKTNAHNYLQLNLNHQKQIADIDRLQKENVLTEAQAKLAKTDEATKSYTLARSQMNQAALHHLVQQVNKLPVGSPQRKAAETQLALISQGVNSENYNLADRAEAASQLGNLAFSPTQQGANPESAFQQGQAALTVGGNPQIAKDRADRHFPGVPGLSSVPLTSNDREEINSGLAFQNEMGRFIDWTKQHSGSLDPRVRKEGEAMAAQLQGAYRLATKGGVYKEGEQGFISNIIDSTPTKFFNSVRVLPQLNAVKNESAAQLDQLLKSKGFQGYQGSSPQGAAKKTSSGPQEGATGTSNGKPVIFKNGKWVLK